jgi:hypothetical protein
MKTFTLSFGAVAIVLTHALASPAQAAEPTLPGDGWVSWQVPAFDGAPAWCCFDSRSGRGGALSSCRLDAGSNGYGVRNETTTDSVTVYARATGGKLDRLQVLATSCPVETKTPVDALEGVATDDSARWLIGRIKQGTTDAATHRPVGESALAALAMHRGDLARDALAGFAHDERFETRKSAVFWLAMLRGEEGAGVTSSVMFSDPSAELREHAAFALSQSKSSRVTPDLIRLGNTDKSADVRSKAWFWLAQTEAAGAEAAISTAVRKDPDDDVREQAVFALSQLPDDRATRALAAIAEDRSLSREQRKRAVFWLSHSESDSAQAYLEKVLAVSSGTRQ